MFDDNPIGVIFRDPRARGVEPFFGARMDTLMRLAGTPLFAGACTQTPAGALDVRGRGRAVGGSISARPRAPTHATGPDVCAEFAARAQTTPVAVVVAVREPQSALATQTAGVFDLSTATGGTDHDPCASPLSAGSSLSGVVSAVVAAATVVLALTGRA